MSNLKNFNNIFANLAESTYNNRPFNFPYESLKKMQKEILDSGKSLKFNYSENALNKKREILVMGGTNL